LVEKNFDPVNGLNFNKCKGRWLSALGRLPWAVRPWLSEGCCRPTAHRPLDAGSQCLRPTATSMLEQLGVQVAKQAAFHSTFKLCELVSKGLVLHFVSLAW
jgi:hypothetical protein